MKWKRGGYKKGYTWKKGIMKGSNRRMERKEGIERRYG
jgi:hypothetical protein